MTNDLPIISLIGHTNVGKSSLFNALLGKPVSIIYDEPGITRDCLLEPLIHHDKRLAYLVDTPGFDEAKYWSTQTDLNDQISETLHAIIENSDILVYVVDPELGIRPSEENWIRLIQRSQKLLLTVVNRIDVCSDIHKSIYELLPKMNFYSCAAKHGHGVASLRRNLIKQLLLMNQHQPLFDEDVVLPKLLIMGKPNAGKSTLTNLLCQRCVSHVSPLPGTTRDMTKTKFSYNGDVFLLIDTAGIRRQSKIKETVEKQSVSQIFQALRSKVDLIIYLIDVNLSFTDHDFRLLSTVLQSRTKVILVANKIDLVAKHDRKSMLETLKRVRFTYPYLDLIEISAQLDKGIKPLMSKARQAIKQARQHKSSYLTDLLMLFVESHQPPVINTRRIKPQFAHADQTDPYRIHISGNQVESLPLSYQRYLSNSYQKALNITGINVQVVCHNKYNPYANKT